jgi:hypothetical protein
MTPSTTTILANGGRSATSPVRAVLIDFSFSTLFLCGNLRFLVFSADYSSAHVQYQCKAGWMLLDPENRTCDVTTGQLQGLPPRCGFNVSGSVFLPIASGLNQTDSFKHARKQYLTCLSTFNLSFARSAYAVVFQHPYNCFCLAPPLLQDMEWSLRPPRGYQKQKNHECDQQCQCSS